MLDDTTVPGEEAESSGDPGTTSEGSTQPSGDTGSEATEEPTEAEKSRATRDDQYRRISGVETKVDRLTGAIEALLSQQTQREDRQPQPEAPNYEELATLAKREPLAAVSQLMDHRDQQLWQKIQESQAQSREQDRHERGIEDVKGRLLNKHPDLGDETSSFFRAADAIYKAKVSVLGREPTETEKVFAIDAAAQEVNAQMALNKRAQVVASKDRARTASETKTTVPAGTSSAGEEGMPELTSEEATTAGKYGITAEALAISKTGDREKMQEHYRKK